MAIIGAVMLFPTKEEKAEREEREAARRIARLKAGHAHANEARELEARNAVIEGEVGKLTHFLRVAESCGDNLRAAMRTGEIAVLNAEKTKNLDRLEQIRLEES